MLTKRNGPFHNHWPRGTISRRKERTPWTRTARRRRTGERAHHRRILHCREAPSPRQLLPYARYARGDDAPWGLPGNLIPSYVSAIKDLWGLGGCFQVVAPSLVPTDEARGYWGRVERLTATPDVLEAATRAVFESDVSQALPAIQAPTLVISRRGDRHVPYEHGRQVASLIPGARFTELAGDDHIPFAGQVHLLDEVEEFLTGVRPKPLLDRVLATVLYY